MSFGSIPLSISFPKMLHRSLLKYSCLGKERKLLESVSIPIKQLIIPIFDSVLIWFVIPSI